MEVREAIARAKTYVIDVFAEEHASDFRLEEVEFDHEHDRWNITISFTREARGDDAISQLLSRQRTYRSVSMDDTSGKMISIKHRDVVA